MNYIRCLPVRWGRRGGYLMIMAVMVAGLGSSYCFFPISEITTSLLKYPLLVAPIQFWGILWLCAAALSVLSAFRSDPDDDRWGFIALIAMISLWAVSYLLVAITEIGNPNGIAQRAFVSVVIFIAFAGLNILVSGWPDPRPLVLLDPLEDE